MSVWNKFPFLRFLLAFMAGILLGIHSGLEGHFLKSVFLISVFIYLALWKLGGKRYFNCLQPLPGLLMLELLFIFGFLHLRHFEESHFPSKLLDKEGKMAYYAAIALENTEIRSKTNKTLVHVYQILEDGTWEPARGKVLLYQMADTGLQPFLAGDKILVRGSPQSVPAPANPGEFNYQQYLAHQQIYLQHFLYQPDDVLKTGFEQSFHRYAWAFRQKCREILEESIPGKQELVIAQALVLGVKDELDNELKQTYAATGAMHILAVSGLHVGIVYAVLIALFGKLRTFKTGRWLFAATCLFILWAYAFITGFSPSVVRAVTMFSLFLIAGASVRQSNIYNTLAIAAFALLSYNPYSILAVGFQLSFLAVLGIVYFQPKMYRLFKFDFWVADKIWALTCVSIAAQLGTLPLGLYYFHQFPTYFLVANVFVIPAAFAILSLGLAILLFSFVPVVASFLGFLLGQLIFWMNKGLFWLEAAPFSIIDRIFLDHMQVVFLFAAIFSLAAFFYFKKFAYLILVFLAVLSFSGIQIKRDHEIKMQRKVVFYSLGNAAATEFILGRTSELRMDSAAFANESNIGYSIQPARLQMGLGRELQKFSSQSDFAIEEKPGFTIAIFQGKKILFLNKPTDDDYHEKIEVDYLVIGNNAVYNLQEILPTFHFQTLIIDNGNKKYLAERLRNEADSLNLNYHSIPHDGAFTINLK